MNDNPSPDDDRHRVTGLLTKEEIFRRLYDRSPISRLYVVPLVDKKQGGRGAIDLRLWTEFILSKRIRYTGLDPLQGEDEIGRRLQRFRRRLTDYQDRIPVRIGKSLTLHPQQFVLGSSFEYVRLPADLAAYVVGRSSW